MRSQLPAGFYEGTPARCGRACRRAEHGPLLFCDLSVSCVSTLRKACCEFVLSSHRRNVMTTALGPGSTRETVRRVRQVGSLAPRHCTLQASNLISCSLSLCLSGLQSKSHIATDVAHRNAGSIVLAIASLQNQVFLHIAASFNQSIGKWQSVKTHGSCVRYSS